VVLGYSRLLWLQFYSRQTMAVLIRGLERSFEFFGGVPNELLFDQLKAVIIDDERLSGGKLLENAEFVRFAAHWGFRIRACRPYWAQTKGKVERPIGYVQQGFFYGRSFVSDEGLNAQALSWIAQPGTRALWPRRPSSPLQAHHMSLPTPASNFSRTILRSPSGAITSTSGTCRSTSITSSRGSEYGSVSTQWPSASQWPRCCGCQVSAATQRARSGEKRSVAHSTVVPAKMP